MPLITLRGYLFDELGVGVGSIEVAAHAKNADGTWVGTPAASTTTSSVTGKWEIINLDTDDAPETGVFGIRMEHPTTAQIRRIEGDSRMMFGQVIGASGGAPLANQSVLQAHILDGIINDTKMGTRVVDDAIATAYSDTGTLTQLVSWFGKVIRAITGEANWFDTPDITLAATKTLTDSHTASLVTAAAHIASTSNPHSVTAAQAVAVANAGSVVKAQSGIHASRPAAATAGNGAVYISTDEQLISFSNGTTWITIGISDYSDLTGIPAGTSAFGTFTVAGQSNVVADVAGDTVTLVAGTGITITTSAGSDTITITNSAPDSAAVNSWGNIIAGGTTLSPDAVSDTLNITAGSNISVTGTAGSDTITIAVSGNPFGFSTIAVPGQSNISADAETDTLNIAAGTGISLTTVAGTDTLTITNSSPASGSLDADTLQGTDGDLFPFMSAVQAIGAEPALATGPWKIQAGNVSADFVSGNYDLALSGTINGYVTIQLMIQHPTTGIVGIDSSPAPTTGASPVINCTLHDDAGALETRTVVLYYFVIHW